MDRKKILIVVVYQNLGETRAYYAKAPSPPLSGLLLAALTPPEVEVEVLHEMVRPVDYETDADAIALSFMDFCAPHAYEVARRFRARGKTVIAGGRYPSTFPEAVLPHVDAVVAGEAEGIWPEVVADFLAGRLRRLYRAPAGGSLDGLPAPRYDLAEPVFSVPVVTEATRGCPFRCSYCQLSIRPERYRVRPIGDVIRDLTSVGGLPWHKRKLAMLYDNNLGGNLGYAKELLAEIAGLRLWGIGVQFSMNCLHDREFLDLLEKARCRMAFLGMESLREGSLASVNKRHNRVRAYRDQIRELKRRGILSFTGVMVALDDDTPDYYRSLPARLEEVDPSAIFLSVSIPIPGTPFHREVEREGRITSRDLARYDGDHLVFAPKQVSPAQVRDAVRDVSTAFYSWRQVFRRWRRILAAYLGAGPWWRRMGAALVLTAVLVSLSRFQRHRARHRVFPLLDAAARESGSSGPLPEAGRRPPEEVVSCLENA